MDVYDSEMAYQEALEMLRTGQCRDGLGAYLPSPKEIEERKKQVRWFSDKTFSPWFVATVLLNDEPHFHTVEALHNQGISIERMEKYYDQTLRPSIKRRVNGYGKKIQGIEKTSRGGPKKV